MALTGNKGEWSEIYALLKLLGDTKVYSGDGELNRIENLFYPIIKIIRAETKGAYVYAIDKDIVIISGGAKELRIPVSVFKEQAVSLLTRIKKSTGASFSISETENFMASVNCHTLKAKSTDKTDIRIVIHDLRTGNTPLLGFSIKSKLGHPSTLLNAGNTTNFIYRITGKNISDGEIKDVNTIDSKSKIFDRVNAVIKAKGKLSFIGMESSVFMNNLILIDSSMPEIVANMLELHYAKGTSGIRDIVSYLQKVNPLNYNVSNNHKYYEYKIKRLLTDVALGMTPGKVWDGCYDATGGYLVVKEDGEVLCYHIYNKNDFEEYLINNTKIETPSSTRYGFGVIEKMGSEFIIKLNLQIRFK